MGHYVGELDSSYEDDKRSAKKARIAGRAAYIQKQIDEKGIATVLSEFITDPALFEVHSARDLIGFVQEPESDDE